MAANAAGMLAKMEAEMTYLKTQERRLQDENETLGVAIDKYRNESLEILEKKDVLELEQKTAYTTLTTSYQHGIGTIEARLSSLNTLHSTAISQSKEMEEGLKTTKDEVPGIDEVIDNSFEKDVRLCVSENSHAFAVMEALNVTNSSAASKTKETLQEAKNGEDIASHAKATLEKLKDTNIAVNKNINRANEEQGSAVLKLNEECAQLNKDQERIKLECDKARMAAQEQKQKLENELEKTQGEHNFTVERAEYVLADIKGLETTSSDARTQSGELDSQIDIAKEDFGAENDEAERKKNELQNQSELSGTALSDKHDQHAASKNTNDEREGKVQRQENELKEAQQQLETVDRKAKEAETTAASSLDMLELLKPELLNFETGAEALSLELKSDIKKQRDAIDTLKKLLSTASEVEDIEKSLSKSEEALKQDRISVEERTSSLRKSKSADYKEALEEQDKAAVRTKLSDEAKTLKSTLNDKLSGFNDKKHKESERLAALETEKKGEIETAKTESELAETALASLKNSNHIECEAKKKALQDAYENKKLAATKQRIAEIETALANIGKNG